MTGRQKEKGSSVHEESVPFDESMAPEDIVGSAFMFYLPMLCLSLVCSYVFQGHLFLWPGSWLLLGRAIGGGFLAGAAVVLISRVLMCFPRWKSLFFSLGKILGPLTSMDILFLAILSGAGEEAFFRGLLQPWLGIAPASFFFAVLHAPQIFARDSKNASSLSLWPWFALMAGFFLGWLSEYTFTWASAAVAHIVVNFCNLRYVCDHSDTHISDNS